MAVTRYRDASEMPPPPRVADGDLLQRIRALWARSEALASLSPPRGVQRFRSIEEANAAREAATASRMRRLRDARADTSRSA